MTMRLSRCVVVWLASLGVLAGLGCQEASTTGGTIGGRGQQTGDTAEPAHGLPPDECLAEDPLGLSTPAGEMLFPPEDGSVSAGQVAFLWSASDFQDDNLLVTVYVSDQPNVFEAPLDTEAVCAGSRTGLGSSTVSLAELGTFYWGLEISDGGNTIRRPADGLGVRFQVSAQAFGDRQGVGAFLLCPSVTAREVTTFEWLLLDDTVPIKTEVFVGRAGQDNPFDSPLRLYEVEPPTVTTFALPEADALPLGQQLNWGLRIETADAVFFSFEGQLGESFLVDENIPPSGALLGPAEDAVWADNTEAFILSWDADAGNCEDGLGSRVFFELLGAATEPDDLFGSTIQLEVGQGSLEVNVADASEELDLVGGLWAWGVVADDGTDQTALPDSAGADRLYRTFVRDTSPRFTRAAAASGESCGGGPTVAALTFAAADDNGADTVTVTVTFAETESAVFTAPEASLEFVLGDGGSGPVDAAVFLAAVAGPGCVEFAHGDGFYGIELNDGVNDPVRQVVEVTIPDLEPVGACCLADGGCAEVAAADCDGAFQGDGTTCADVDCARVEVGACCLSDGSCADGTADDCVDGQYQGDGTTCDTVDCAQPTGACCLPTGACTDVVAGACLNGTFQGVGTSCATAQCAAPPPPRDCNRNSVDDGTDIAAGTSLDCNANGVPDECEGPVPVRSYVDAGAGPGGNGSSWATAFNDLQAALAAAGGGGIDEIWVAAGTYRPTVANGPQDVAFALVEGVTIYGGFAGNENCLNQRSPHTNLTILSGDLNGDDALPNGGPFENSIHVVTANGVGPTAVLDGFTITAGASFPPPVRRGVSDGGAVHCLNASPTIVGCLITGNTAGRWGGGMYIENGSPTVRDCTFANNTAGDGDFGGGGGVANLGGNPAFLRCIFLSNNGAVGGGLYNDGGSPTLTGCHFDLNTSTFGGGALHSTGGVAALADSTLAGNSSGTSGGGVSATEGDLFLVNCLVTGNLALDGDGGGVFVSGNQAALTNCTFVGNDATGGDATGDGGGVFAEFGDLTVVNSIFWANSDDVGTPGLEESQISLSSETAVITYTCIEGLSALVGPGNIGSNPLFDGGGFTLLNGSPCVNAGSNYAAALPQRDLIGGQRIQRCRVDMGAYESPFDPQELADCNTNGVLDDCDIFGGTSLDADHDHVPDECFVPPP